MEICVGISDQSRAYFTGLIISWGSRSTCIWSISLQKEARRSKGNIPSDIHLYRQIVSIDKEKDQTTWNHPKIVAAFRGMHVSPAKHSYGCVTDGRTDRQTTDKVIPMCRYASQATQKHMGVWQMDRQTDGRTDRRRTKWSLCVAMLRRRHINIFFVLHFTCFFAIAYLWNFYFHERTILTKTSRWNYNTGTKYLL